jgi:GNAT superfamily N-acetyltransferase
MGMEWIREGYRISDCKEELDAAAVFDMLSETYWAAGRSRERVELAMEHSLCFGLYDPDGQQIGFLRAVTDYATFAWICDVIVRQDCRGKGLGKWLVACMLEHPALSSTNKMLGTRDAHGLYEQFGFERRELLRKMAGA